MPCEICRDTGWYGDNGPGILGNREYQPCDQCAKGRSYAAHEQNPLASRLKARLAAEAGLAAVKAWLEQGGGLAPEILDATGSALDVIDAKVKVGGHGTTHYAVIEIPVNLPIGREVTAILLRKK